MTAEGLKRARQYTVAWYEQYLGRKLSVDERSGVERMAEDTARRIAERYDADPAPRPVNGDDSALRKWIVES